MQMISVLVKTQHTKVILFIIIIIIIIIIIC